MGRCWLCEYNREPEARKLSSFIQNNVAIMGPTQLAMDVHESLICSFPDTEGTGYEEVYEHINSHTLSPSVRVAATLRSLLDLKEKIGTILTVSDEEGNLVIDGKNVAVYLKVVSEIMQIYKSGDSGKFLFSNSEGEPENKKQRDFQDSHSKGSAGPK